MNTHLSIALAAMKQHGTNAQEALTTLNLEHKVEVPLPTFLALVAVAEAALEIKTRQIPVDPESRQPLGALQRLHLYKPLRDLDIALGGKPSISTPEN